MVYGGVGGVGVLWLCWWNMVVLLVLVVLPSAVDLGRFIHRYLAPGCQAIAGYSRRPSSGPASTVRNAGERSKVKIQVKIQIQ